MEPGIRLLIAEDHAFFRFGLRSRLSMEPQIAIVGEAITGQEAIDLALALRPDLVLMDLKLPGIGGIEATLQIRQALPATQVLMLTMFDDDSSLAALRAGARGYLLKSDDVDRTVEAIYAVARGERRYSRSIEDRLHRAALGDPGEGGGAAPRLTARLLETLQLMALGLSNAEIAARLGIDDRTVRNKVSDIYDALALEGQERKRRSAILRAIERGLI
jgi:DNA-binding NarL/FixJ family response regulator